MTLLASLLIGLVAGLRAMTAPAALAWAGWIGWIDLGSGWARFTASPWAVAILTIGAVAGTLGGAAARGRLATGFGRDRPAALTEDGAAIVLGLIAAVLA